MTRSEQAKQSGRTARERPKPTARGVDVEGSTKEELYERARKLGIRGRSTMDKRELGRAIGRTQRWPGARPAIPSSEQAFARRTR